MAKKRKKGSWREKVKFPKKKKKSTKKYKKSLSYNIELVMEELFTLSVIVIIALTFIFHIPELIDAYGY